MPDRSIILGVPFDAVTLDTAVNRTVAALEGQKLFHVATTGPEFIMTSQHHKTFREVLQRVDLSIPEGMGVVIASKILGKSGIRRVPGMEYLEHLVARCAREHIPVFLFGAMPSVAERAAHELMRRFPGLEIAGVESGFRGWMRLPDVYITWRIRHSRAKILLVALGAPQQELWIDEHRAQLGAVRAAVGVGGAFDVWSGVLRRAPKILSRLGLEWVWRMALEPRKRWRRIRTATWSFMRAVWNEKWRSHV